MTRVTVRCPTCGWSVRRKVAPDRCEFCSARVEVVTIPGPRPAIEQLRRVEVRCRPLASSVAAIGDARAIAAVVDAGAASAIIERIHHMTNTTASACTIVDVVGTIAASNGQWPQVRGVEDVAWHGRPLFHAGGETPCELPRIGDGLNRGHACARSFALIDGDDRCGPCRFVGCGRTIMQPGQPTRTVCDVEGRT